MDILNILAHHVEKKQNCLKVFSQNYKGTKTFEMIYHANPKPLLFWKLESSHKKPPIPQKKISFWCVFKGWNMLLNSLGSKYGDFSWNQVSALAHCYPTEPARWFERTCAILYEALPVFDPSNLYTWMKALVRKLSE